MKYIKAKKPSEILPKLVSQRGSQGEGLEDPLSCYVHDLIPKQKSVLRVSQA